MNWKRIRVITGPPAEGDRYLKRQHINDKFWALIERNEPVLLIAPRRVGKSSVMLDIKKNPIEGHFAIHENIQSDKTQQDFFKRLFNLLLDQRNIGAKVYAKIENWVSKRNIKSVSIEGVVEIQEKNLNYKEELLKLIEKLGEEDTKIVFLLDEFPDVLMSISKSEGADAAEETLNTIREIQHNENAKNFSFVLAGSVGIDHVVNSIGRPKLINLFHPLRIEPLKPEEAKKLIDQLTIDQGVSMQIAPEQKNYLLEKTQYLLPYFIQLMLEKCDDILYGAKDQNLTDETIDQAFNSVVEEGRNFEDWESRLSSYLVKNDAKYCIDILTHCAHLDNYTVLMAFNRSKTIVPDTGYKELLDNTLVKDGYLVEKDGKYHFLSPFLKEWWKNRHPKFEIES